MALSALLLEAAGLFVARGGRTVLHGVSISVAPGDCICISGPNGAGKTALLKTLQYRLRPYRGSLTLGGRPVRRWRREISRRIAYVPQVVDVDSRIPVTALDVAMSGQMPYIPFFRGFRGEHRRRVATAMEAMGVSSLSGRPFGLLSGGEMQKVLISRALAQPAGILLLDEPTNSLDRRFQETLRRVLLNLREGNRKAVVIVTHDASFGEDVATQHYVLDEGRMVPVCAAKGHRSP